MPIIMIQSDSQENVTLVQTISLVANMYDLAISSCMLHVLSIYLAVIFFSSQPETVPGTTMGKMRPDCFTNNRLQDLPPKQSSGEELSVQTNLHG